MPVSQRLTATHHFDLRTALHLASAAELVYAEPGLVEQTALNSWRYAEFLFLDVESTQCLVAADPQSILVCFRGTEAERLEDWMADLDFSLVPGPWGGRVHEGFYDALSCVWHLLDNEVRRLQDAIPRRLWVTGHSLGAALAALSVARWCEARCPVAGLYTFGQPRTGDSDFARSFDFAFRPFAFRVVNHLDVITRAPPRSLGYQHLGTFVYLTDSGAVSDDIGWWQRFLTGWSGAVESILDWGQQGLADHRMANYRQQIAAALRRQSDSGVASAAASLDQPTAPTAATRLKPRRRAA